MIYLNVNNVSPVLDNEAIVFESAINVIYIGKRLQSCWQRPDVTMFDNNGDDDDDAQEQLLKV